MSESSFGESPAVVEQEPAGMFSDVAGELAEGWKTLSVEDQQAIADALAEVTGDGPGVCSFVPAEDASLFREHLRNYMSVEKGSAEEKAGLKGDAASAMRRILSKTDEA